MFARTQRLLLKPGLAEDAPALSRTIANEQGVRHLSSMPWPYDLADAEAYLAAPEDPVLPSLLIFARTEGAPRLVGACGLGRRASGRIELGYWFARPFWGLGYATEAGRGLIDIARTLRHGQLDASHFIDNPASGRVLEKLGFVATGLIAPRYSHGRSTETPARLMRLDLAAGAIVPTEALAA